MRSASNADEKAGSATSDRGRTANRAAYRIGRRVSRAVGVATPVLRAIRSGVVIILLAAVVPAAVAESPWRTGVALTYDGAGNVLSIGPDRYAYDLASRIASATTRGVTRTYAYDAYGNRTDCVQGVQPCGATMLGYGLDSSTNRLTHGTDVRYDPRGNLTAFAAHEYTYDLLDAQTSDKWATGDRKYLYDADGERIGTLEDGQWTWTIRDTNGKVVREFTSTAVDGEWSWSRDYVWREGLLLASIQDGVPGRHHYHLDHLGTAREVTNSLGVTAGVHSFHPFGVELGDGVNEPSRAPLQFTGHERDAAGPNPNAHLDYMHARYYSPTVGRFLSVDPVLDIDKAIKEPQRWNRYSYVMNNPLRYTDPTGREADPGEFTGVNPEAVGFVSSLLHVDTLREAFSGFRSAPLNEKLMAGTIGLIVSLDLGSNFVSGPGKARALEEGTSLAFRSFGAFKRTMGAAGADTHWHHIVEQTSGNKAAFRKQALNNLSNVVKLDSKTHKLISGFYSSKQSFTGGKTVREWLSTKSFKEQYEFGKKMMERFAQ